MKNKYILFGSAFVVAVVVLFLGTYVMKYMKKGQEVEDTAYIDEALSKDWQLRKIGNTGIQAIAPSNLEEKQRKIGSKMSDAVQKYEDYIYAIGPFSVVYTHFATQEEMVDVKKYVENIADLVNSQQGTSRYKHSIQELTVEGRNGVLLTGSAKRGSRNIQLDGVFFKEGVHIWQVLATYDSTNAELRSLIEKIFNSVEITIPEIEDTEAVETEEPAKAS